MKSLGEFLRSNRKRLGFTQEAVAEKLNIVPPVLSKWENDKSVPDLVACCKLCNIFGIGISDLINLETSSNHTLPPEEYNSVILGNTIKELRQRNDWTQSEVGNKLFVTSQTVSKWEAGGVTSLELLQKLSTLYAVPPEVLLFGFDSSTTPTSTPQEAPVTKATNKRKTIISVVAILLSLFIVVCAVLTAILVKSCNTNEDSDNFVEGSDTFVLPVKWISYVYNDFGKVKDGWVKICVDFLAPAGTEVHSVAAGEVKSVLQNEGNIFSITIDHSNGVVSIYEDIDGFPISVGDKVKAGQVIAAIAPNLKAGSMLGDHLRFAMEKDGVPVDPKLYLPKIV